MGLNFNRKKDIINKISDIVKKSLSIIVVNPQGINTNNITEIRKIARNSGIKLGVFRNTLLKLAIKNTNFECLKKILVGPTLIGFSLEHPSSAARLFKNFIISSNNSKIQFKILGAVFEKKIISSSNINTLAQILTFNEALHQLIITIKEACIGKLLRTLISVKLKKDKI